MTVNLKYYFESWINLYFNFHPVYQLFTSLYYFYLCLLFVPYSLAIWDKGIPFYMTGLPVQCLSRSLGPGVHCYQIRLLLRVIPLASVLLPFYNLWPCRRFPLCKMGRFKSSCFKFLPGYLKWIRVWICLLWWFVRAEPALCRLICSMLFFQQGWLLDSTDWLVGCAAMCLALWRCRWSCLCQLVAMKQYSELWDWERREIHAHWTELLETGIEVKGL